MGTFLTVLDVAFFNVILPILIISFLIFIHELGHYMAARWIKAEIKEFAIGMGPKLLSHRSKKTNILYAIRAIPMGGSLTLVGEDEHSDSENAFSKKPVWQRFLMIVSGSIMNLLFGFILMAILVSGESSFLSTTISRFPAIATSNAHGLMEGDQILRINNKRTNILQDVVFGLIREGAEPVRVTVLRNGERVVIEDVRFPVVAEGDIYVGVRDFEVVREERTFSSFVRQTFFRSLSTVDMIWTLFFDLITGRFGGIEDISGPVGITQIIGESAREAAESENVERPWGGFIFLIIIITINLGVMNLLPLPALDGGRIVFLVLELIRRKPIKPEHEGYVHLAGFALLMIFAIVVTYQDIARLIVGS